ncbi:MAG: UDP-N-acetylmuramoyl-tripeptide--D-alanyl-D-alanine ligase [Clostridia bacterium]|nr:UDP-N-acetylmuramoyl-tripeptide--D-alanyl-D-alanine ligase [Clostridia bacterium]
MQILSVKDIIKATHGELASKTKNTAGIEIDNITIDSRKVCEGALFVPLAGEKADGHDYINSALKHGALASLTGKDIKLLSDGTVIRVSDTRKALGDIARYYKEKYPIKSVAITGSVGKTTTKDMVYAVLKKGFNTHKTPNNFNNDIGVPLTIFGIEREHDMAVIEMGMNHFGEIDYLAGIAKPDIAIITNIGMSHVENLSSQEGIFKAKLEIANRFTEKNTLYVNGDDKFLKTLANRKYKVVKFGIDAGNDVYAKDIESKGLNGMEFTVVHGGGSFRARITQPGIHNVYNALAAVCAGLHFGLNGEACAAGLKDYDYTSLRLEIINDCYNSSPDSVRAALKVQRLSDKPRRVAVLGDILEMGEYAPKAHYELGADVVSAGVDMLVTAGENAARLAEGARAAGMENVHSFATTDEAVAALPELIRDDDSVLVKASHGMKFIKITEAIQAL